MNGATRRRFMQSGLGLASLTLIAGCQIPPSPWQSKKIPRVGFLTSGVSPQAGTAELPLLEGRTPDARGALAYVCRHQTCLLPTQSPSDLARSLLT